MIQDIAPHQFDNSFCQKKPLDTDYVMYIRDNKTFLSEEGEIPTLREIEKRWPGASVNVSYLFSIDGRGYFLLEDDLSDSGQGLRAESDQEDSWKGTQYFRKMTPRYQAFAAVTAAQIWRWRQSRRFCGRCGSRTEDSGTERALICPKCGQIEYPKISPAVIVAITNKDKLLMSRYRDRPYKGYALIAGFVEVGESFEETVRREVMEEVGLKVKNVRYFKSQPWAFTDTEMIGFFADLDGSDAIKIQEDELAEAAWYSRGEIPDDESQISVGSEMMMAFKYNKI